LKFFSANPLLSSVRMFPPAMRLAILPFLLAFNAIQTPASAGEAHNFIVAGDGYGVQDCLGGEGECGKVVADAWCEAHGQGPALSFGKTDDVTGAISTASAPKLPPGAYFITCGD
jgi:hypothetical protein